MAQQTDHIGDINKMVTAVEWLMEQVNSEQYQIAFGQTYISIDLLEQAKQMEKEQMEQCYKEGIEDTKKVLKDELKDLLVFPNPYKK